MYVGEERGYGGKKETGGGGTQMFCLMDVKLKYLPKYLTLNYLL
jgi:hypothetical protein